MRYLMLACLFVSGVFSPLSAQLMDKSILEYATEIAETEGSLELISDSEARYFERKRITILNKESEANLFYVYYDSDNKIENLDADIYDLSGAPIRKVKKSEIRDVATVSDGSLYDDSRVRYIELHHAAYPYVLEFTYTQRIKGIGYAVQSWAFQDRNTTAVTSSTFSIKLPKGKKIQYQVDNLDLEPIVKISDTGTEYTWTAKNLPALRSEPLAPASHRKLPVLRIIPDQFKIDNYTGSMSSWSAYGTFLHELWRDHDQVPAELLLKIEELVADATTDREKIARLYRLMQQNKRYVSVQLGIGGWQPFDVEYVEERGYGDCKALSNYMKSVLQSIGIESYPVIVKAGEDKPYEVSDDFAYPAFNHAILYVPQEDMWLECTSSNHPAGYLGQFTNDRKVLLVTPSGGQLARTPKLGTTENRAEEAVVFTLAPDGSASLQYEGKMHGILHEYWRNYSFYYSQEELENEVREKGKLPSLNLAEVKVSYEADRPESSLLFSATAARYAAKAGKRLFVPINLICPYDNVPEAVENRRFPVVIPFGYTKNATFSYTLPEGYGMESLPKAVSVETAFGTYELDATILDNVVTIKRKLIINDDEFPADQYEAYREFLLQVAKYDASKMVLVSN